MLLGGNYEFVNIVFHNHLVNDTKKLRKIFVDPQ